MNLISVAALALVGGRDILLVRKRGTCRFMLPGGKFENAETPVACLRREIREELGLEVDAARLDLLGRFRTPAANEDGAEVDAIVYAAVAEAPVAVSAAGEIAEHAWRDLGEDRDDLAPLLRQAVLPALRARAAGQR